MLAEQNFIVPTFLAQHHAEAGCQVQERDPRQLLGSLQGALHSSGTAIDHALFVPLDSSSFTVVNKGQPGSPHSHTWDWPLAMQQAWAAGKGRRALQVWAANSDAGHGKLTC